MGIFTEPYCQSKLNGVMEYFLLFDLQVQVDSGLHHGLE
jgi:hypothetical protein